MPPDQSARIIRVAIDRLAAATARQRTATAARLGLSVTDLLALAHVGRAGEVSPGRLAQALVLSSSGTTSVIRRLCQAQLLARMPGPANHHNVVLHTTPQGETLISETSAALDDAVDALTADLTAADRAVVEGFLARLADLAEREADRLVTEATAAAASAQAIPTPVLWG
jgi:DNA-binding MarR family transcriptional regulator